MNPPTPENTSVGMGSPDGFVPILRQQSASRAAREMTQQQVTRKFVTSDHGTFNDFGFLPTIAEDVLKAVQADGHKAHNDWDSINVTPEVMNEANERMENLHFVGGMYANNHDSVFAEDFRDDLGLLLSWLNRVVHQRGPEIAVNIPSRQMRDVLDWLLLAMTVLAVGSRRAHLEICSMNQQLKPKVVWQRLEFIGRLN
jgi:hypothetical protein